MSRITEVLLVNLLLAVGCAVMSIWLFQQRKAKQAQAIADHQKLASARWLKFVPNLWLLYRFAPHPSSREWEVNYLFVVALSALMSLVFFAVFAANLVQLFGAS